MEPSSMRFSLVGFTSDHVWPMVDTLAALPEVTLVAAEVYPELRERAAEVITTSDIDGSHFEAAEHRKLGQAVAGRVREILA
jgi:hypothetical protein